MKSIKTGQISTFLFIAVLALFNSACSSDDTVTLPGITTTAADGATSVNVTVLQDAINALPMEALSVDESAGLIYIREEEKLARDVYIDMFARWNSQIFDNISNSEQTHTDAVLLLLNRYSLPDPVGNNAAGVFTNISLQSLYDSLIAQGSASLIDALQVGAEIEEIDIIDIQAQLDNNVDNQDIALVYNNLLKGSRNHLRSFVKNLEAQGMTYQPLHLTQQVYDDIINSAMETN